MVKCPDEGDTVYVTVGVAMPREDRALVKGTAINVDELEENTFMMDHEEVLSLGSYGEDVYENEETAREQLEDYESGAYGVPYGEEYGEVWSYDADDLRLE